MKNLSKNNHVITIIVSCIIVVILLLFSPFLRILNKQFQNGYYIVKNNIVWFESHPNLILVELDQESIDTIWTYPFSRSIYAELISNLSSLNPAVIAFDFLFLDPSSKTQDDILKAAVENFPRVVAWSAMNSLWEIQWPYEWLWFWPEAQWFLSPIVDASNNTVYSFSPYYIAPDGTQHTHFTIKILKQLYNYLYEETDSPNSWKYYDGSYHFSEDESFPLSSKKSQEVLINFIPGEKFQKISFADLLSENKLWELSRVWNIQDSIVLIGPAADGFKDEFYTPNWIEYGMYIHANIINTILSKQFMIYFDRYLEWILIFLLIIVSVSVNLERNFRKIILWNILIISVFWFIFPLAILLWTNLILNFPSEIIFSLLLAFAASNIVKFLIEDANKTKLNKALSEYVSSDIAEEILGEKWTVNLDWEKKELVCFFSDIAWFTTISEKLKPEELVSFLREYLWEMTKIIMKQEGHVDKYEWDAIMALWGAFTNHEDSDYVKACEWALLQQKCLKKLNIEWNKKFQQSLSVRMWIHGGSAIIWNIGAVWMKMEFTALGDNINLASRLEWVNKYYGTYICVSDTVYQATKNIFNFRYLDTIQVKGKDIPVMIYELRGYISQMDDIEHEFQDIFNSAMKYYKLSDFNAALKIFSSPELLTDSVSSLYKERCENFILNPPDEAWAWVWRFTEK